MNTPRLLPALLCAALAAGCLPAYDNKSTGAPDGGGNPVDSGGTGGTGKFVSGILASWELAVYGPGAQAYINGHPEAKSPPANSVGQFKFEIPQAALGTTDYLLVDGTFQNKPILKTWFAPKLLFDGGKKNTGILVHFFKDQSDMMGIRGLIATELQKHGDIPSAASFATDYHFVFGALHENGAIEKQFKNYTISVSAPDGMGGWKVLDNTACKPDQQCCYYYTYDWPEYTSANPPLPSVIAWDKTTSPNCFAVVCPKTMTGAVLLTQTAPLTQLYAPPLGSAPKYPFNPIEVPLVDGPDQATLAVWPNN